MWDNQRNHEEKKNIQQKIKAATIEREDRVNGKKKEKMREIKSRIKFQESEDRDADDGRN